MCRYGNKSKFISICLAIVCLISGIGIPYVTAEANDFVYMSTEYARASNYSATTVNRWKTSGALALSNVSEETPQGLTYDFQSKCKEATHFEGVKDDLNVNGLLLKFSNFTAADPQNATFTVRLSDNTTSGIYSKGSKASNGTYTFLGLTLKADIGALVARYEKNEVTVITDEALKLENLQNKEFAYRLSLNDDDGLDVSVEIGETSLSGEIGHEALDYLKTNAKTYTNYAKTSVLIGPGKDAAVFGITFVGYQNGKDGTRGFLDGLKMLIASSTRLSGQKDTLESWKDKFKCEDLSAGGVRMTFTNADTEQRDGIAQNLSLDGLFLQFSRFITSDPADKMMIRISDGFNDSGNDIWCKGSIEPDGSCTFLGIVIDTEKGVLIAKSGNKEEEIITDDALKYDSISKSRFSLHFLKQGDGFRVRVTVGTKAIDGVIPQEAFSRATALTDTTRCGITVSAAGDNSSFVTDFIGYKTGVRLIDVSTVIAAINNIGEVSLSNLATIREARALYDDLSTDEKQQVTNYNILTAAEKKARELIDEADSALTVLDKTKLRLSGSANPTVVDIIEGWPDIKIRNLETGGVNFNFTEARLEVRDGLLENINLNGLTLQFDNFKAESGINNQFAVFFANGDGTWGSTVNASLAFVLDPDFGTISLLPSGETIIQNDLLKLDSLKYQRLKYTFFEEDNGDFLLTVNVCGRNIEGTVKAEYMHNDYLKDYNSCMMAMSAPDNSSFSVDFIGYKTINSLFVGTVDATIKQINSIGKITIDDAFKMRKARYMYDSLSDYEKVQVTNYNKLTAAEKEFYELSAAADSRLEYFTPSAYLLYDETLFYGVWKSIFSLETLDTGGTRYYFKNSYKNIRQGITLTDGLDGIMLQFDNIAGSAPESCSFTLFIGGNYDNGWGPGWPEPFSEDKLHDYPLTLVLNPVDGKIIAKYVNDDLSVEDRVIIESDLLKWDNIRLQRFSYQFTKTDGYEYTLSVAVGGKTVKGTIGSELIRGCGFADFVDKTCFINISNWDSANYSFDFIGYYNTQFDAVLNAVIAAIDKLPAKITTKDIDTVLEVKQQYEELLFKQRRIIYNYPTLAKAINQVYKLEEEDISWTDNIPKDKTGKPLYGEESIK